MFCARRPRLQPQTWLPAENSPPRVDRAAGGVRAYFERLETWVRGPAAHEVLHEVVVARRASRSRERARARAASVRQREIAEEAERARQAAQEQLEGRERFLREYAEFGLERAEEQLREAAAPGGGDLYELDDIEALRDEVALIRGRMERGELAQHYRIVPEVQPTMPTRRERAAQEVAQRLRRERAAQRVAQPHGFRRARVMEAKLRHVGAAVMEAKLRHVGQPHAFRRARMAARRRTPPKPPKRKAAEAKSADLSGEPGSYWAPYCQEDSDPITLERWADHERASDIVSIALPGQPDVRFCYERKGLLQTLRSPLSASAVWASRRPSAKRLGDVYRNPRGQYFDAGALELLADPDQFAFESVASPEPQLVGSEPDLAQPETVYQLRPAPLPL